MRVRPPQPPPPSAYQDLVGFYTPIPGPQGGPPVAAATLIMRTELRGHIPHWAFAKTAGPTGMHLLHTLQVRERERELHALHVLHV